MIDIGHEPALEPPEEVPEEPGCDLYNPLAVYDPEDA